MNKVIGTGINRQDGLAKVTGAATFAAEHQIANLLHGYLVTAGIAKGRIKKIDTQAAAKAKGVIEVFTHKNAPAIFKPSNNFINSKIYEARLPLGDDQIYYAGQIIALVVADTFERARDAAHLVKVEYIKDTPSLDPEKVPLNNAPSMFGEDIKFAKGSFTTGDFSDTITGATATITATYKTATELHAPMEPHAIIALWQSSNSLTIYEPSQWVAGSQNTYSELFGLPREQIRIITPFLGGGFGSKAFPWPHSILCVAAARKLQRPLKVVVSRRQMTTNTGHRSQTEQTVSLAANADGNLQAIEHIAKSFTSPVDVFAEPCTNITPVMYATPNLRIQQLLGVLNVGTPTFMRAPGETPGMYALESAMDELAWELGIDPVELRLRNETKEHQSRGLPFSAKYFQECLRVGAEKFGWENRPQKVRSLNRNGKLIGWGMAGSTFPGLQSTATVKVRLLADGTAHILTSGNDMGTGTYTIIAGTAAEFLELPVDKVKVELGDSLFPNGGIAGGSQMTANLIPAVMTACEEVLKTAQAENAQEAFASLRQSKQAAFEAIGSSTGSQRTSQDGKKWAFQSWGAHFCEVSIDEEIGRLQVTRWVSVMNIGKVMNPKTAASQIRGGVIMGIGHALMEECKFDPNIGYPVVYDLATYHYPTHADIPRIDVTFVGEPDLNFNRAGVRGVGEIGITGVSAAIANAIYHATGKRLRELPITPDKLI